MRLAARGPDPVVYLGGDELQRVSGLRQKVVLAVDEEAAWMEVPRRAVKPPLPFIPGHEGAGNVVALGPGVTTLKEGDRVGVPWLHSACGACDPCITGWETLCPSQRNTGYSVNGSYAEYVVAPAAYVGRIPDKMSFDDAAPILCAGVTTYKGIKETEARPGQWIVISGIGGLGHVAIQYAKAMGLHVAAVDVR